MRDGIRKIVYDSKNETYIIATDDPERCGYPLSASRLLNERAYIALKNRMQDWTHITYERVGCFDIITSLERPRNVKRIRPLKGVLTA